MNDTSRSVRRQQTAAKKSRLTIRSKANKLKNMKTLKLDNFNNNTTHTTQMMPIKSTN
jgi:hypothetical protein